MSMKTSHSEDNADQNISGSTRQHIISRLNKAARYANDIVKLLSDQATSGASDTDVLEARGYAFALAGAEEFEKQAEGARSKDATTKRWVPCLTNYSAARIIYNSLLKATKNDLFKEVLAGTTDPSIRYAAYQHRIPRTVGVPSVAQKFFPKEDADLVKAVEKLDPTALQEEETSASGERPQQSRLFHTDFPMKVPRSNGGVEKRILLMLRLGKHWYRWSRPPRSSPKLSPMLLRLKIEPMLTTTLQYAPKTQPTPHDRQLRSWKRKVWTKAMHVCRTCASPTSP